MSGVTLAIIIGLIIGNIFNLKSVYDAGITFSAKTILALAIMLMGLKLEVSVLNELGIAAILIIILMVFITILAGFIIGKMFGLN